MTRDATAAVDGSGLPRRTARLQLRRLSTDDLSAFVALRADPELGRWQGWSPMSAEDAWVFLAQMQTAPAWQAGTWFQLAMADGASGRLLGDFGVFVHADGKAEIGVTLARDAQGRGLATEAITALIGLLFERPQVRRVIGITDDRNGASARLLGRAGLHHTQTLQATFRGEPCTEWLFERPRSALEVRRAVGADAEPLARFAAQSFVATCGAQNRPDDTRAHLQQTFGPALQAAEIADPAVVTLLALIEGRLLGYAQLRRHPPPLGLPTYAILALERFYVHADWHGQGLAAPLLAAVLAAAAAQGDGQLWLSVWEHNPRAMAFYRKAGFVDVGPTRFMVGQHAQTDRVMVLALPPAGAAPTLPAD